MSEIRLVVGLRLPALLLLAIAAWFVSLPTPHRALAAGPYTLLVSHTPDRSDPEPLAGQTASGNIYVFTSPDTSDILRVRFWLDNQSMTGAPRQTENNPPYDFGGGTVPTASPFDTTRVPDGQHTITAAIDHANGTTEVVHATFTVANDGPALTFNPATLSFALGAAGTDTKLVALDTTNGTEAEITVSDSAPWLSVSPVSGIAPANLNVSVNATGLALGTHTASVTASAPGYTSAVLPVTLNVTAGFDQVHLAWVDDPSTTISVVWRTWDLDTPSTAQYRRQGTTAWQTVTGAKRSSGTTGTLHEVTFQGLSPSTTYEYRVRADGGAWSNPFSTRTAPPPGPADFDVIYVADTGLIGREDGLATGTAQVIDEIAALNPHLVLGGGDYAYFSTDKRYGTLDNTIDAWFNQMQPAISRSPIMPTYGNHEVLIQEDVQAWIDRFPTPAGFDGRRNYSFDVGDVHFVSILAVSNTGGLTSQQLNWIEQDILAAKEAGQRWIIPYMHVSPFADGKNHPSNIQLRNQLGPLFESLGVKLVIASHDQSYERTYPLTDVPSSNTPTSTSTSCYTMADGVTWVKVSPGGKLSNINSGFSPWTTNPPPPWTAFRDNTMHHFLRVRVSADGVLRVEAFGVAGDGSPPVIQDSFEYTTGSCPGDPVEDFNLYVSSSSNRGNPQPLEGQTVSGTSYVFTSPDTPDIVRVRFWLDDPSMSASPLRIENSPPYDFAGGTVAAASPFDTASLPDGEHTITAAIERTNQPATVLHATFTVDNLPDPPTTIALPGTFQAEDYRAGGQDIGYFDTTAGNQGGVYRSDDVDIQKTTDPATPGGFNVGWIRANEWLSFNVSVETEGEYDVTFLTATIHPDRSLRLEIMNGQTVQNISGSVTLPNTNGWQNWTDVTTTVHLPAGAYTLRIFMEADGFNLNYVTVEPATAPPANSQAAQR